ncbi:hypothetical protein KU70_04615 [Campylobacter fetus]|nr:hypothetical protein KU70_04615 [Campylobacter fetus]
MVKNVNLKLIKRILSIMKEEVGVSPTYQEFVMLMKEDKEIFKIFSGDEISIPDIAISMAHNIRYYRKNL